MVKCTSVLLLLLVVMLASRSAQAEAASSAPNPRVHHAPLSTAVSHEDLEVGIDIRHPQRVKRALLVYVTPEHSAPREIEFRRGSSSPYVAQVPGKFVSAPWFDYAIEIEELDGRRVAVFAQRAAMHRVQTAEPLKDIRERAYLERLGGRRSVFFSTGEYVDFGQSRTLFGASVRDRYFRVEGGYTYRPLRDVLEFSLRLGIVRGESPIPESGLIDANEPSRFDVGLNYGAPSARFRLSDQLHLDAEFLTSVTEVGFSVGIGGALVMGDPYGSALSIGFESVQVFGTRFYTRMDTVVAENVRFAPVIEVTDMPHASRYGVRLLGEATFDLGSGLALAARGGYQARDFTAGGPSFGANIGYAF